MTRYKYQGFPYGIIPASAKAAAKPAPEPEPTEETEASETVDAPDGVVEG